MINLGLNVLLKTLFKIIRETKVQISPRNQHFPQPSKILRGYHVETVS